MSGQDSIGAGTCYALFAYDIGIAIHLDEAERRTTAVTKRGIIHSRRRVPEYFEVSPQPLRVTVDTPPVPLARFTTQAGAEITLYDFGAVSIRYRIAFDGSYADLLELSETLYENAPLRADSRHHVQRLLDTLGEAVERATILPHMEDYMIFHVTEPARQQSWEGREGVLAQILRSERRTLSADEIRDATACAISFASQDYALIDWSGALLFGPDLDDTRAVLEFANVELLEMRVLDGRLDRALDQAYEVLARRRAPLFRLPGVLEHDAAAIARLQVDSALLFERVTNSVKLLGDQYLARVYRLASQRFHLHAWDSGILRKLQTLENIYDKMTDRTSARRMEVLEWVIILLIAFEVTLSLLRG
jgi:hypothetical protein